MPLNNKISHHGKWAMALSGFEIAMGGITSIPVVGGLIFLGYKGFGESLLDASKLKPKQKTEVKKEALAPEKKEIKEKSQNQETKGNLTTTTTKKASQSETQKPTVKKETPAPDKKEIKEKAQPKKPKLKITSQSQTKLLKANRKTSQQKEIQNQLKVSQSTSNNKKIIEIILKK